MISYIAPLPIGNAVRVIISAPAATLGTRVLRNTTGVFTGAEPGPDDSIVFEAQDAGFIDFTALKNGAAYFYAPFDYIDAAWVASPVVSCTPAATAAFDSPDAMTIVCDRLRAGLASFIAQGRLKPESGSIAVLTAPPVYENTKFPVVSVHLRSDGSSEFGIGSFIGGGGFDAIGGDFTNATGELADVSLEIIVWVVGNPDVRIQLRKAIRAILLGNMGLFDEAGLSQIQVSQTDTEDFESYNAPVYQTSTVFSCVAPVVVTAPSDQPLSDVSLAIPFD